MEILNTQDVKKILTEDPDAKFSLQRIRVDIQGGGSIIAGYHIFRDHQIKMMHVIGDEIWDFVAEPNE